MREMQRHGEILGRGKKMEVGKLSEVELHKWKKNLMQYILIKKIKNII